MSCQPSTPPSPDRFMSLSPFFFFFVLLYQGALLESKEGFSFLRICILPPALGGRTFAMPPLTEAQPEAQRVP